MDQFWERMLRPFASELSEKLLRRHASAMRIGYFEEAAIVFSMPSYENPFPGMNPYLQGDWAGVHTLLIGYIHDALATELPPDLAARAEERITVASEEEKARARRVDVAVVENWRAGFPPVWTPQGEASPGRAAVDEPLIFLEDPEPERWVEIRNAGGRLITVIKVLSPANKGAGWAEYKARQRDFLAAGVALVEIDLIRGGLHTVAIGSDHLPLREGTRHLVCVARPHTGIQRREVYLSPLRERLPTIRVPLRLGDPDAPLAIQPLVDRCYRMGRYWLTAYARPLDPPLPLEEAAWAEERLRAAGFV